MRLSWRFSLHICSIGGAFRLELCRDDDEKLLFLRGSNLDQEFGDLSAMVCNGKSEWGEISTSAGLLLPCSSHLCNL